MPLLLKILFSICITSIIGIAICLAIAAMNPFEPSVKKIAEKSAVRLYYLTMASILGLMITAIWYS